MNLKDKKDEKKLKHDYLFQLNKKNKNIDKDMLDRHKHINSLSKQIQLLQEKMNEYSFELEIMKEIKDSQKTFLQINKKIQEYIDSLRNQNILNTWNLSYHSPENEKFSTDMYSIKNATYSGTIIIHYNKESNFYKISLEISLSSILLNMTKEDKKLYTNKDDIKIIETGKVIFNDNDKDNYIETLKNSHKNLFLEERAPLFKEFKDVTECKYKATDFIMYDDMVIDGFNIIDESNEQDEDIPF